MPIEVLGPRSIWPTRRGGTRGLCSEPLPSALASLKATGLDSPRSREMVSRKFSGVPFSPSSTTVKSAFMLLRFLTTTKNGCLVFGRSSSESNLPVSLPSRVNSTRLN